MYNQQDNLYAKIHQSGDCPAYHKDREEINEEHNLHETIYQKLNCLV